MKRAYYDCPFEAMYMMKHFGIAVTYTVYGDVRFVDCENDLICEKANGGHPYDGDKIYVHPDSMGVFEPDVGDLVKMKHKDFATSQFFYVQPGLLNRPVIVHRTIRGTHSIEVRKYSFNGIVGTIIQRNNKPFIWPKWEETE